MSENTTEPANSGTSIQTATFIVEGLTCPSCVQKVDSILSGHSVVEAVSVDLDTKMATIHFYPETVNPDVLKKLVQSAGYGVTAKPSCCKALARMDTGRSSARTFIPKPLLIGTATAVGVISFYLGLITLTSDWYNARMQFADYRWWLLALAAGLGIQTALYSGLRNRLRGRATRTASSSVAASGGMSTVAMAVCCSHYLATFLPLIGLPFLSAAFAGLEKFQVEFLIAGVLFNTTGIVLMIRQIKNNNIPASALFA